MAFPEQLKKARLAIGYTQQQVADAMGITNSTYCGYETGKRQPDVAKIKQLAKIIHTSGDVLLDTGFQKEEAPTGNPVEADALKIDDALISSGLLKKGTDLTPKQVDGLTGIAMIISALFND